MPPRATRGAERSVFRPVVVIPGQDARAVAVGVVILVAFQRPDEGDESEQTQKQGHRYQQDKHVPRRSLMAFSVTRIDEVDIASAAASGVAKPARAIGIEMAL